MIELHLIGYTEDLAWLVLDTDPDGGGTYTVALDDTLLAGVEEVLAERRTLAEVGAGEEPGTGLPAAAATSTPVSARLSPAEIQAQLRAGRSVRAVAKEADAPIAYVERWLGPILGERERILDEARQLRPERTSGRRPLGDAVERGLRERGLDADAARWLAARRADGRWRVSVRFELDGRTRTATWVYDRDQRTLQPQSSAATQLVAPRRRGGAPRA